MYIFPKEMARREKQNRAAQPKKTRGVIDITKGGKEVYIVGENFNYKIFCVLVSLDDDEEGVLDNLLQCLNTGSVFKQ